MCCECIQCLIYIFLLLYAVLFNIFSLQINGILHINASSWQGVLDTTLCDKVCQVLVTGHRCFSLGTLVVSTNKTDCHDKTEILLKVVINNPNPY